MVADDEAQKPLGRATGAATFAAASATGQAQYEISPIACVHPRVAH
jgi:hypothetical protein